MPRMEPLPHARDRHRSPRHPEHSEALEPLERRRLTLAGLGLALVGAGVSVAADAGHRRAAGEGTWVARGTLGLCLLGAGLRVFGEAVAARAEQRMLRR